MHSFGLSRAGVILGRRDGSIRTDRRLRNSQFGNQNFVVCKFSGISPGGWERRAPGYSPVSKSQNVPASGYAQSRLGVSRFLRLFREQCEIFSDLYGAWEALGSSELIVFDERVFLNTLATHSENFLFDIFGNWVGGHSAKNLGCQQNCNFALSNSINERKHKVSPLSESTQMTTFQSIR